MSTIDIQISNVVRVKDNVTFIAVDDNNRAIKRTLNIDLVDSWDNFADWLINQNPDYEVLPEKEKSLNITFHNEISVDPETGEETTFRVVDNVIVT